MRKTFLTLMVALPLLGACTSSTPANPTPSASSNPAAGSVTPVTQPTGAPGAGQVATGAATGDAPAVFQNFNFAPNSVTIKAGQSVAFQNPATAVGTLRVIANDGTWDSGTINPGNSFVQKFNTAGTFYYHHQLQTSAIGTVVVQ